jgi:hypothetical protein
MANIIDYIVDVLASSTEEINVIAARMKEPSAGLVDWVAERFQQDRTETAENLRSLVPFEPEKNLFYTHESVNKARRFRNSFKRWVGIVQTHLFEVSEEFPAALFMVEYFDQMASYSGKFVVLGGRMLCETHDGNHHAQSIDWVLLDIFAPFRAEYDLGVPFGSLWQAWVEETAVAVEKLRKSTQEREAERKAAAKAKLEAETDEWLATLWPSPSGPSPLGTKLPPFEDVEE